MPYIGQGLTEGRRRVETFIATANQTTFNIIYDAGYVDVYQNGILLAEADYTATNGSQVVLAVGAALNDEITIIAHQLFSVTDTVSAAQGGTFTGAITASGGVVGNITGQVSDISNHLIDEDNMVSNDATKVPSQQSVKAYVDTEVSGLVDSAPSTLDTLNELATALGDDANFSTTITNSIATKLPLAGGTLTGDITITSTDDTSSAGPIMCLYRNSASPDDGDYLGQIKFQGESDTGVTRLFAKITAKTSDVSNGTEDGLIETAVKVNGSNVIVSRQTGSALKLINGTGLEVAGTTDLTGDLTVDTNTLHVDTSNNRVGIGTSSPSGGLHVYNSVGGEQYISSSNSALRFVSTGGVNYIQSGTATSSSSAADLIFTNVGGLGETMRIDSSGNFGIGTSTIGDKLVVEGAASATTSIVIQDPTAADYGTHLSYDDANSKAIFGGLTNGTKNPALRVARDATSGIDIDSSGNVGIGTASPKRLFHLNGGNETTKIQITNQTTGSSSDGDGFQLGIATDGTANIEQRENADLNFYTNNDLKMTIDSSGNVGIGTNDPTSKLHVHGDTSNTFSALMLRNRGQVAGSAVKAIWSLNRDGSDVDFEAGSITVGKQQNWTTTPSTVDSYMAFSLTGNESNFETMRLNSDGFAQLNSASQVRFTLGNEGTPGTNTANWIRGSGGQLGLNAAHDNIHFEIGGSPKMKLTSSGLVLPGNYQYNTVDGFAFYYPTGRMQLGFNYNAFGAEIILGNNRTASGETAFIQYRTNSVTEGTLVGNGSGLTISNVSDYRKKENINELPNGSLEKVINVRPVTYTLKEEYTNDTSKIYTGFIAHEFQEQFPNSVRGVKDELNEDGTPKLQSIDIASNELLTHLIKSIQELKTENDALKARLDSAGL